MKRGQRIAVTGTRGLIGRRLLTVLRAAETDVIALEGDIRCAETFSPSFDVLVHLGGAMPRHFAADTELALRTNIDGASQAVDACRRNHAHLIFTSTAGVYDRSHNGPRAESSPLRPDSPYAESKLRAEHMCLDLGERATVLRLFSLYGPGQGADMLIGYLISQVKARLPIVIHTPAAHRDFVHVDDVATAILATIRTPPAQQVINIGSGHSIEVREVALAILARASTSVPVEWRELTTTDNAWADISAATHYLGWSPTISLPEGLDGLMSDTH